MVLLPLDRMWERAERARDSSDIDFFLNLMYYGELLTKVITLGLVAAIQDDSERHRYRQLHRLVRADGLGEWEQALNDLLIGPASQHLLFEARNEQRELTKRCKPGEWQYEAVALLHKCLEEIEQEIEPLPTKVDARRWFSVFVRLRNKTRGHGAPPSSVCSKICLDLKQSIELLIGNFNLFRRSWAYLHQNLSGKYRVTRLTEDTTPFDPMRSTPFEKLRDGVYVYFGQPRLLELLQSDVDASDFLLPNGNFNGKRFELLSYITGDKEYSSAEPYLAPTTDLPKSETQGMDELDVRGASFSNLPPAPSEYIHRQELESELSEVLLNDRHPVITLVGRGGIGKTYLALSVLHQIADEGYFEAIFWFSARDIDLLPHGPRLVKPHVLTERDIADEFVRLVRPDGYSEKEFDETSYLAKSLTESQAPLEGPVLFVFDNFETARSPLDLFSWIDTYIRLPNKILITTRFRDFKGDYPVEVSGMNEHEFAKLVDATSKRLGVYRLLTDEYRQDLYRETDGHPYVVKILLGEVAKAGTLRNVPRILASKDDILNVMFERTYARLSPVARRVFLTLCNWRSIVPELALEAVLLRPANEKMDVESAIEELNRSALVEISTSSEDHTSFLSVPLVAKIFGSRKLTVSPMRSAIEADTLLLRAFGAAQHTDIEHGIAPRVESLFRYISNRIDCTDDQLDEYLPMLEFIARKYPPAWLRIASLYEHCDSEGNLETAKRVLRHYLEYDRDQSWVWEKLATLCLNTDDKQGAINALVSMCQVPGVSLWEISSSANRLNHMFYNQYDLLNTDEKRVVVRQLADVMEARVEEADATDCSRLAWLYLHLHNEAKAREFTVRGLQLDPNNEHCLNLASRLGI